MTPQDVLKGKQMLSKAKQDKDLTDIKLVWATKEFVLERLEEIHELFESFPELPWNREQILRDLPGKWETTLLVLRGNTIVAFSINSIKERRLFIHALFVSAEYRRQ